MIFKRNRTLAQEGVDPFNTEYLEWYSPCLDLNIPHRSIGVKGLI